MIDVTEAVALREVFRPGYTFQLSLPVTVDGKESWTSNTWMTVVAPE